MAVVLFSGGLDSTTISYDVGKNPFRYGLSRETGWELILLTGVFSPEERAKKEADLSDLVAEIEGVSLLPVRHEFLEVPDVFGSFAPEIPVLRGSVNLNSPMEQKGGSSSQRALQSYPYTPGLHLLYASAAVNLLLRARTPHHTRPVVLCGFKYEGFGWDLHDSGRLANSDTSPVFIEKLNQLVEVSVEGVLAPRFRAPFLESRMDRYAVLEMAYSLGVPVEKTSSCIQGWMQNCGHCIQCVVRNQAMAAYKAVTGE